MVCHPALGIIAANSRTRIDTAVARTALIAGTVRVQNTFRPARTVRIADVISRADAIDGAVLLLALSVGTARIGIARSWGLNDIGLDCSKINRFFFS